jgi:hypothetical protein
VEPGPELTKVQRNEIYKSIEEGGLDPAECDLIPIYKPTKIIRIPEYSVLPFRRNVQIGEIEQSLPGVRIARIKHLARLPSKSESIFDIRITSMGLDSVQDLRIRYSYESTIAGEKRSSGGGWQECVRAVGQWAKNVKREVVDPDLWTELRRRREFFTRG